jgi:hypothetical protein
MIQEGNAMKPVVRICLVGAFAATVVLALPKHGFAQG